MFGLLMEFWNENIIQKLLKQIEKVVKFYIYSEEIYRGRFARICVEFDITRPLKIELKYTVDNAIKLLFFIMNITDSCYGYGQQDHKFKH